MLRINKDVEYALISLIAMGQSEEVLSARELSSRFRIPYGLLGKILYRLAQAEIVESVQGPHGGYRLKETPDRITVGRVMEAIHGPSRIAACLDVSGDCSQLFACNIRGVVGQVQRSWDLFINSMTLAQFAALDPSPEAGAAQ